MRALGQRRVLAIAVAVLVGLALVGWVAARQIRSPAQVAADTAAPKASAITVPVVRRTLSTTVIVRGTVRYGAAQPAVLGTSRIKQGSDIVTRAPRRRAQLAAGDVAMSVDGRPVFVLPGAIPMSRDLHRGLVGPDVRQLEIALGRLGFPPGAVDGVYDAGTEAAVTAFYLRRGWDPFGATDVQLDQLRTAEAAAATARDARLQALNNIAQAKTATPSEVQQAKVDAATARDAVNTAQLAVTAAQAKLRTAQILAANVASGPNVAQANAKRDQAAADADVAIKRAALNTAIDDERVARTKSLETALDAPVSERDAAASAARQAAEAVPRAQAELDASIAAARAASAAGPDAITKAKGDRAQAASDVRAANDELHDTQVAVTDARSAATIAARRIVVLSRPLDTRAMQDIAAAARAEERRTRAEVARLAAVARVQVPANEVLFFPTLPLRVDTVKAKRGATVTGTVMTVTSSRLAVDSSLSVSDVKLVRTGNRVVIEDQDLGIKTTGRVSRVADAPGTNRVDPSRFYFAVAPSSEARALVGASVKLTIAVKSTKGAVLAVPPSALSVGGDGDSRVQVRRGRRVEIVKVVPGLAAGGLVEVRPLGTAQLDRGDLVIVGSRP
jgi:peptidoglycan hydrolase-like protein with peptidoglycan-binding domain